MADEMPMDPFVSPLGVRLRETVEELKVRWFMLDAQQKQVILLGAVYLLYTLLDVGGAVVKARIGRTEAE